MKEALKLALESMKRIDAWLIQRGYTGLMPQEKEVITVIEEALAQQEPVATVESVATVVSESGNQEVTMSWWHEPALLVGTKLYTTPPASVNEAPQEQQSCDRRTWGKPWVSLTDEEQQQAYEQWQNDGWGVFYKAIEAKLKAKNGFPQQEKNT